MTTPSRKSHRNPSPRAAVGVAAWLLALASGCATPGLPKSWSETTANEDKFQTIDSRKDRLLCYREFGDPARPPLLFVHGLGHSKAYYRDAPILFEEDYHVFLIDLLGHGGSSKPPYYDYSAAAQGRVLAEFILAQNLHDAVLIGHSYGAVSSMEAVRYLNNGRGGERVIGLVLMAPPAFDWILPREQAVGFEMARSEAAFPVGILSMPTLSLIHGTILKYAYSDRKFATPELVSEYEYYLRQPNARLALVRTSVALREELTGRADDTERFSGISIPIQLIYGSLDRLVPREVIDRLRGCWTHEEYIEIEDAGHAVLGEQPEAVLRHIRRFIRTIHGEPPATRPATRPAAMATGGDGDGDRTRGTAIRPRLVTAALSLIAPCLERATCASASFPPAHSRPRVIPAQAGIQGP
jgi:pimeloyl-ACP methyl ester carboxylesterase